MSEIKIPNCPCCDGESKLHNYGGGDFRDTTGKKYFIKCEKCGLTTKHSYSKDEVLMNWGKRKPMERILTKLEEKTNDIAIQYENNYEKGISDGIDYAMQILEEEGGIE